MPAYVYRARDRRGRQLSGVVAAGSPAEVAAQLRRTGHYVSEVRQASLHERAPAARTRLPLPWMRARAEELILMYAQLADMVNAGLPILVSLETIERQASSPRLRHVLRSVASSVSEGRPLSEALSEFPDCFSNLYVRSVAAGESSGHLGEALKKLAAHADKSFELKKKIQGAMIYPAILLSVGLVVVLGVVTYVLPNFVEVFSKSGVPLPLPTRLMYGLGMWIKEYWYLIPVGLAAAVAAARMVLATPAGALTWDSLRLRLPVVGPLLHRTAVARVCRTLAMMVASGVPLLNALAAAASVAGNRVIASILHDARGRVSEGVRLSASLSGTRHFPPDVVQMLAIGEETGNLDGMLDTAAGFYEKAVDRSVKKLMTVMEPIILVILGAIVGMIMASVLLPMLDMAKAMRSVAQ